MQTTASSEKKYAPPKRSEKQIGNTTFIVNSFFREKSDASIAVKLERTPGPAWPDKHTG